MADHRVRIEVNGNGVELDVAPDRLLVETLRLDLGLTGTKLACGVGVCGACSVLVDGRLLSACLLLTVLVDGAAIVTIEGIGGSEPLSELQESFLAHGAAQCGFCTPGQIVAATALLQERPGASPTEIRDWLGGNLCRCTGYTSIVAAVGAVAAANSISSAGLDDEPAA